MTLSFWCVLVAIFLPYAAFGIARNRGRDANGKRVRDNRNPRDFPNRLHGAAKRAWDAHLNAFEALPSFAAAVIIAYLTQAHREYVDGLAAIWVIARVCHLAFYIADLSTLRSVAQYLTHACVLGLFVMAAMA
jgi:uncharacterized MAPEG superfamily protein